MGSQTLRLGSQRWGGRNVPSVHDRGRLPRGEHALARMFLDNVWCYIGTPDAGGRRGRSSYDDAIGNDVEGDYGAAAEEG